MKPRFVYIDYTHELDVPASILFALLEDISGWPRWVRRIPWAEQLSDGPWRVGTRIRFKPDFAPAALSMTVFHHEKDRTVGWGLGRPGSIMGFIEHRFDFEPLGPARTRVRHREIAEGPLALLTWPMQPLVYRFNRDWADDLERRAREFVAAGG